MENQNIRSVYVLKEEWLNSNDNCIIGIWSEKAKAIKAMRECVVFNTLFDADSIVDLENGYANSDSLFDDVSDYCNYHIEQYEVL
ncbi:MAG: hypothetical protein IKE43_04060 [Coriobacteriales bacterium]|nr:hypothetical protein [Coriobacteriales bacterium]